MTIQFKFKTDLEIAMISVAYGVPGGVYPPWKTHNIFSFVGAMMEEMRKRAHAFFYRKISHKPDHSPPTSKPQLQIFAQICGNFLHQKHWT